MTGFLLTRLAVLGLRLVFAAGILLLLAEGFRIATGGSGAAAGGWWQQGPPWPEGSVTGASSWPALLGERAASSAKPFLLAWGAALLTGAAWGLFAGRWQRYGAFRIVSTPFQLASCVPVFWFATVAAAYAYFVWHRPGYADEIAVESGPDLVAWWNALVVALPATAAATASHLRLVESLLCGAARTPAVRGLRLAGERPEDIYYRRLLRQRMPELARLFDNALAPLLGLLVFTEWAFRYEGLGSLLIDSARSGSVPGLLLASLSLAAVVAVMACFRECSQGLLARSFAPAPRLP